MKKIISLTIILFTLLCALPANAQSGIVVIVNQNNTAVNTMSEGQVKLYFLKKIKIRWPNINEAILPVDLPSSNQASKTFYDKVLKMTKEDVSQYFVSRQISNAIKPPVLKESEDDVINYVTLHNGAIAYVSEATYLKHQSKVKAVLKIN